MPSVSSAMDIGDDHGFDENDGYDGHDAEELDDCYRHTNATDADILTASVDLEAAIAELAIKYDEEALKLVGEEESRKRRETKEQEDAWWTESRMFLTELLFEYYAKAPASACSCECQTKTVFAIDIQGKNCVLLYIRVSLIAVIKGSTERDFCCLRRLFWSGYFPSSRNPKVAFSFYVLDTARHLQNANHVSTQGIASLIEGIHIPLSFVIDL